MVEKKPRNAESPRPRRDAPARDYHAGKGKPKLRKPEAKPPRDAEAGMRIAKVMARAGLCSRRDAEAWIEQGRVTVNGKVLLSPATNVGPNDEVSVDGAPLAARERTRLFLFHKPRGLVTTDKDPEGRQTIFDYLKAHWPDGPRVVSIGRLDINTEGLLLLTNDGGLARVLELPSTGWVRRYRARANGKTDQSILDRLRAGLTLDGVDYSGIEATLDRVQGDNVWLSIALREGKNREIKRVLEHINLFVNRLIRISYGPFQLGELAEGKVEEVRTRVLRDQLGPALAQEADADFDSPLTEAPKEQLKPPRGRDSAKTTRGNPRDKRGTREMGDRKAPAPRGTRRRDSEQREPPAPLEPSFKPRGPRKHISAMRTTGAEKTAQGERKRTLVSATADRKGRAVVVERKAKVSPRDEPAQEKRAASKTAGRGKNQKPYGAPGKPRSAAQAPAWQDATKPPARFKSAAKKSSPSKAAGAKGARRPTARPGRPPRPR